MPARRTARVGGSGTTILSAARRDRLRALVHGHIRSDTVRDLTLQQLNSFTGTVCWRVNPMEDEIVTCSRLDCRKHLLHRNSTSRPTHRDA